MKFIKSFFIKVILLLFLIACFVIVVDPFFHYHEPIGPLKKVFDAPEYQCIGSLKNFDYDSVIIGSSVAENYNNALFNEKFGCNVIKGIQHSGTTKDLLYLLDIAQDSHELKYVFYSVDASALASCDFNILNEDKPLYLYNNNPFDDVKYVWNKDVIFEKIPYMVMQSLSGYREELSYNWAKYKNFSEEIALTNNVLPELKDEHPITDVEKNVIDTNIRDIVERIDAHPETEYYLIYPPYSKLWWENVGIGGDRLVYEYAIQKSLEEFGKYSNVKIFNFLNETSITENLDNYMDPIHFSGEISDWIVEQM